MIAADIKALPLAEKLQIMETLWEEFRSKYDASEISIEMKTLLDQRRQRVRADIEGLRITAGTHRTVHADYQRLLSRVFPHGIFYTFEEDCAVIWVVIDLRRDPQWIRHKLTP